MVIEVADIRILPGKQAEFDAAIQAANRVLSGLQGYLGHRLLKGIDSADRYLLMIEWATVKDHTVGFRQSPVFVEWRAMIGPFFAALPVIEHFSVPTQSG
jgi:heme-degrading monooxygenase HmoA